MRRKIWIGCAAGRLEVTRSRVFEARADAVPHEHVDGRLGTPAVVLRVEQIQISQPKIFWKSVLERFDEARRGHRARDERDAYWFERLRRQLLRREAGPKAVSIAAHRHEPSDSFIADRVVNCRAL